MAPPRQTPRRHATAASGPVHLRASGQRRPRFGKRLGGQPFVDAERLGLLLMLRNESEHESKKFRVLRSGAHRVRINARLRHELREEIRLSGQAHKPRLSDLHSSLKFHSRLPNRP